MSVGSVSRGNMMDGQKGLGETSGDRKRKRGKKGAVSLLWPSRPLGEYNAAICDEA